MSRVRLIMLTAAAAFAFSAVVASAAMAVAEFKNQAGTSLAGESFTATSVPSTLYSKSTKTKIVCLKDGVSAKFASNTVVEGKLLYKECEGKNESEKTTCKVGSAGKEAKGEIETNVLEGTLGETETGNDVGMLLKPTSGVVYVTLEGKCLPTSPAKVEGGIICEPIPLARFSFTGELLCGVTMETQKITKFRGSATEEKLKVFGSPAALEDLEAVKFTEEIELG